jgi:peroxiredoxin
MMKTAGTITIVTALVAGTGVCQASETSKTPVAATQPAVAARAEDVRPLKEGAQAPGSTLRRPDGEAVKLSKLYAAKPSVLIFYRGGWCPYCNTHLGQISKAEPELLKLGYQVLAISPDRPEALAAALDKGGFKYELLSDSDMELTKAFGLAFRVDDPTVEKYRGFGIDLDKASGRNHHLLPVPAVYIVDTKSAIRFAHWDADYKKRLTPDDLLTAAKRVAGQ